MTLPTGLRLSRLWKSELPKLRRALRPGGSPVPISFAIAVVAGGRKIQWSMRSELGSPSSPAVSVGLVCHPHLRARKDYARRCSVLVPALFDDAGEAGEQNPMHLGPMNTGRSMAAIIYMLWWGMSVTCKYTVARDSRKGNGASLAVGYIAGLAATRAYSPMIHNAALTIT